jgi:hypothetical protein
MPTRDELKSTVLTTMAGAVTPESVANAICDAVLGPVGPAAPVAPVDPNLVPRDETHDSVDPATGTLTPDAVAKRAADQAALDADQAEADIADAEEAKAAAEEAGDEAALAAAKDKLAAAQARKQAADDKRDADKAALGADSPSQTAMVTSDPSVTAAAPPVDQPVTTGVVNTTGSMGVSGTPDPGTTTVNDLQA